MNKMWLLLSFSFLLHAYDVKETVVDYMRKAEYAIRHGDSDGALQYYLHAHALQPDNFALTFAIANAYYMQGQHQLAIIYYDKAIRLNPRVEQSYFNKGVALSQLNHHEQAADAFMQALNANPSYNKVYMYAGQALEKCGKKNEALIFYKKGAEAIPENSEFHRRLALIYKDKDMFEPAIDHLRVAIEKNPTNSSLQIELANALHFIDGSMEALELYEKVLEKNPRNYQVLYNFGYTLKKMGHLERAIEVFDKVLEQSPDYALARFARATTYLSLGDWERGWQEYEWRFALYNETPERFQVPLWDGSDIAGKRILIYAEQGLGDSVQFIRYAQKIKEMGAYVIVEVQAPLKDLLSLCPYIDHVCARSEPLPAFDVHIPMMSLPRIFKTDIDTVPHNIPYLYAKPELVAHWAEQLKHDTNFKIGICWQGNKHYHSPLLRNVVAHKSMHVKEFAPIAQLDGVSLYSLQKIDGQEQLAEVMDLMHVRSFGQTLDQEHGRFMDTVAIMLNLDLILTIDTGTCHVAAALGIPTWNLLPEPADWRWMLQCTGTPWYDNMRLFRQPKPGDWQSVIQACKEALMPVLSGHKTIQQVTAQKTEPSLYAPQSNEIEPAPQEQHNTSCSSKIFEDWGFENIKTDQYATLKTMNPDLIATIDQVDQATPQELARMITHINRTLSLYEKELKQIPMSVFDHRFMALTQKIAACSHVKRLVASKIKQTIQTLNTQGISS